MCRYLHQLCTILTVLIKVFQGFWYVGILTYHSLWLSTIIFQHYLLLLIGKQYYGDDRGGIEKGGDMEKDILIIKFDIPFDMLMKLSPEVGINS